MNAKSSARRRAGLSGRRRAGLLGRIVAIVVGLLLLAADVPILLVRDPADTFALVVIIVLAVLGVWLVLSGLSARRSRTAVVISLVAVIALGPAAFAGLGRPGCSPLVAFGTVYRPAPADGSGTDAGKQAGVGVMTVDLTGSTSVSSLDTTVSVGAGQLVIKVPADRSVRVQADVDYGRIDATGAEEWTVLDSKPTSSDPSRRSWQTPDVQRTARVDLASPGVTDGEADLVVHAHVRGGQILVQVG